jgi:hypothetical protein
MRGNEQRQDAVFSDVSLEQPVPTACFLEAMLTMVSQPLGEQSAESDGL